jgi:hypothetical protein
MYLYHFHDFANVVEIDLARRARELERVEPPVAAVDPAIYDDYVGRYAFEDGHRVAVLREGRSLMVDSEGAP